MIAKTTTTTHLSQVLAQARAGTDALFGLVRPEAFYERPVPERHRIIFYFGHLEAFDWNLMSEAAAVPHSIRNSTSSSRSGSIRDLQLPQDKRSDWPAIEEVQQYNVRARRAIDELSIHTSEQLLSVALEHRLMHAETFAYLLHDLPLPKKHSAGRAHPSEPDSC